MSQKVGVIGKKYVIMPFKLLGFHVHYAESAKDIREGIQKMAEEKFGVIFMTEEAAVLAADLVESYQAKMSPAIIMIPNQKGSTGMGMQGIEETVEKAIGQNIL